MRSTSCEPNPDPPFAMSQSFREPPKTQMALRLHNRAADDGRRGSGKGGPVNIRQGCWFLPYAVVLGLAGCHHEGCTRLGDQPCVSATDWVDCYAAEGGGDVRYPCPDMARFCTPQGNWHTCAPYRADPPPP